jgi:enoyl-CoA hydratase/carnithine racemase
MTDSVQYAESEGIATLTLNRPDKQNAITSSMYAALAEGIERAEGTEVVRVLVLLGEGKSFTAGNDLSDFINDPPMGDDTSVAHFLQRISTTEKPVVAAVGGAAIGIGTTMLLHCDLVVASRPSWFQLPFVKLGLVPEAASSLLLPRLLGHHRAAELLLLGEPFDADTALEYGLVNRVVDPKELITTAMAIARALAAQPANALRLTKQLLRSDATTTIKDRIAEENRLFSQQLSSAEAKEAFEAFFHRRG